jgi:pimeloyl-ACP methyl ester carboxylesterase
VTDDHTTTPERLMAATQNIRLPMLLVRGRMSDRSPKRWRRVPAVPHAEYVDVENARHMVAGDRNDIFTEAVLTTLHRWSEAQRTV